MQPHPVADVGWANGMDQGITGFFLQGFALHCADGQPKGSVLADQGVIGPLAEWGSSLAGHPVKFPQMDTGTMMPLLLGMLGLGGLRTAEKLADKAAK